MKGDRSYLVEGIQQFRDQRTSLAGNTKNTLEAKLIEISDETIRGRAEGERVAPEVPLECNDRCGEHAGPDERKSRLSAGETRVEESEAGNHDHDHGRGHENVGLVTRLVPLIQVLGDWGFPSQHTCRSNSSRREEGVLGLGVALDGGRARNTWETGLTYQSHHQ